MTRDPADRQMAWAAERISLTVVSVGLAAARLPGGQNNTITASSTQFTQLLILDTTNDAAKFSGSGLLQYRDILQYITLTITRGELGKIHESGVEGNNGRGEAACCEGEA